jgi:beta-carotene 3-hydroxylase
MATLDTWAVVAISFVLMEPFTYLAHRFVMHGFALGWHRSHHGTRVGRFERNDLFPVTFAGVAMVVIAAGFNVPHFGRLVSVVAGVGAYGAAYVFVHDVYIHRRLPRFQARVPVLELLSDAHALHHRFGGEPYGMLFPVVPASVRARAGRPPNASRSGSIPSHVPVER